MTRYATTALRRYRRNVLIASGLNIFASVLNLIVCIWLLMRLG